MDKASNQQEIRAPRNERLTADEAPILKQVIYMGDVSLNGMWPHLTPQTPQLSPEYQQAQTYQAVNDGRQYQFAPVVGASAVQTQPAPEAMPAATPQYSQDPVEQAHFEAWERNQSSSVGIAAADILHEPETSEFQAPDYLDDTVATADMMAEARRKIAEAQQNDPYARPEGV